MLKPEIKKEIASDNKTSATLAPPERLCDVRCKICNSDYIKQVHDLKKAGHTLEKVAEIVGKDFKLDISRSSLSRHFAKWQERKDIVSAKIMNDDLVAEATNQAVHTKQIVSLIDKVYKLVKARIDSGTIRVDISDLEKLLKLRYQVLAGHQTDENDIAAIFQKATDKYGLNLQQGILFKSPAKAVE